MSNHEEFHDERDANSEASAHQETVGREDVFGDAANGSDSVDESAHEEQRGWFRRLADRQPKKRRNLMKSTRKRGDWCCLGSLPLVESFFSLACSTSTHRRRAEWAEPRSPCSTGKQTLMRPIAPQCRSSALILLKGNSCELTEKDVLGTMRNRGAETPITRESVPRASRSAQELGQIDVDDPALADAYRRTGTAPPKRAVQPTDWNKAIAEHQASQQVPSKPAPAPHLANFGGKHHRSLKEVIHSLRTKQHNSFRCCSSFPKGCDSERASSPIARQRPGCPSAFC